MDESYLQLSAAMRALAGQCDGAQDLDGVGFNGRDARFGQVLAETPPDRWSPRMAEIAHRMAQTYRQQLERHGINVARIPAPPAADQRQEPPRRASSFTAALRGDLVVLTSEGFPGRIAVDVVKAMPGRAFRKKPRPAWYVPLAAAPELLRAIQDGHVGAPPPVLERIRKAIADRAAAAEASRQTDAEIEVSGLGGELMGFQRAGVAYGAANLRTWIADEMGLGKTVQGLAILKAVDAFPAVVACPASLKINWQREAMKWLPGLRLVKVLEGRKPTAIEPGTGLVVVNYEILPAWLEALKTYRPNAVIFDEAHLLKSRKAQRTQAAKELAKGRRVRLMLTGTPVLNSPADLITQLEILDRLRDLGGWKAFTDRYCIRSRWGGFEQRGRHLDELNARMRAGGMFVRRLKADVLEDLPEKRRVRVPLELAHRSAYDAALQESKARIKAAREERQAASAEGRKPEGWALAASVTAVGELRRAAARCKLPAALAWIREMLESGEKLVIFGFHRDIVGELAKELEAPVVMGGMDKADKQAAVDAFQTDPDVRAICCNIAAAGVGLTLTAASNVVLVESGWTPGDNDQAEDRCHRIGQRNAVTAWYLDAEDTIDQWHADLIERKRRTVDAATEGEESAESAMVSELAAMIEAAG